MRFPTVIGTPSRRSRWQQAADTGRLPQAAGLPEHDDWAAWADRIAGPGAHNIAVGRVSAGVVLLVRPTLLPRLLGVDSATARRLSWLGRMAGARDLALGVGQLQAAATGAPTSGWVVAGAACDTADAVVLSEAASRGHVRRTTGVLMAASALVCAACAARCVR